MVGRVAGAVPTERPFSGSEAAGVLDRELGASGHVVGPLARLDLAASAGEETRAKAAVKKAAKGQAEPKQTSKAPPRRPRWA